MIKLLIGGSPCTFWSIAQKDGRETEPSGMGWELFVNYLIAKQKFKPDFFLYENNKSAAEAIKAQIRRELNVWDGTLFMEDSGVRYDEINSARVSAQNRERFYVHNCGDISQPKDRGILLRDILESGIVDREKSYCLKHQAGNTRDYFKKHHTQIAFEPIRIGAVESGTHTQYHESKPFRVYSADGKSVALQGNAGGGGAKTGLYAVPINELKSGKARCATAGYANKGVSHIMESNVSDNPSKQTWDCVVERLCEECIFFESDSCRKCELKGKRIYEVRDGFITIKDKQYSINLEDGFYLIRKLTVKECCRLQTLPDDYCRVVSPTQAYKGLGNGWTAEVIIHILNGALRDVPRDEEIVVLSMYDGIGTGRYCLDKIGFTNVKYFAYEIDKYAMQVALSNYPDIVQMGDAFDLRHPDWTIGY